MSTKKIVVALTGLPGSGKGHFSSIAREYGFDVFVCGDVVREEVSKQNLPLTRENLRKAMMRIREEDGPSIVIGRLLNRLIASKNTRILVEGIRSIAEVKELKKSFNVILVAIHSSPSTRFERIRRRGRSDDPRTSMEFELRDMQELSIGIGGVVALADEMIVNEGSIGEFTSQVKTVLGKVLDRIEG